MKTAFKFATATVIAFAACAPATLTAEEPKPAAPKPATEVKESAPVKGDFIGTLFKEGDKIKFKDEAGKVYLVTKNNTEKVTAFIDKKVKISGQSKSKDGANGKPFHMIVYINKIEAAATPKAPE